MSARKMKMAFLSLDSFNIYGQVHDTLLRRPFAFALPCLMAANRDGLDVFYYTIRLICQTLVYGMYTILMPLCCHAMLKRGLQGTTRRLLFCMLIFMFSLSTAHWVLSIYHDLDLISSGFVNGIPLDNDAASYRRQQCLLMNALALINCVLTDGVVVWRAWILCRQEYRKALMMPIILLCCTALSAVVTIGIRISITVISVSQNIVVTGNALARSLDYAQVLCLALTLLTNLSSTSIIGIKAWRYRRWITTEIVQSRKRSMTRGERVVALLVEAGVLYTLSTLFFLAAVWIRLPFGTLGDIYVPVNAQFAGMYPTIVLLFVNRRSAISETVVFTFQGKPDAPDHERDSMRLETIEFRSNPLLDTSAINEGETEITSDESLRLQDSQNGDPERFEKVRYEPLHLV
ncbi:uncharacterized protein EV420DRAFT_125027 [Desarmillaria tabescens]|uniref:Uncharacterized protein n=1 Tax=Armillaria tabescens TaxID=1929756 RepID=A0AA39N9Z5_ARMTA|nr:uncharacterized protein EV420DRAFT_125027 [Desarmillaria tabescens]KAK0461723.1 hypothetical protein EV420DRAFT_125027 [Desarmillaria tabescens]